MSSRRLASSLTLVCSLVGLMAFALPAQAQTPLSWSGVGTSGTDPYGHDWVYDTVEGSNAWSFPGNDIGALDWSGPDLFSSFRITFTDLPVGVAIMTPGVASTGFLNVVSFNFWTPTALSANSVTFTALPGDVLKPGYSFLAHVLFTGDPQDSAFTVDYNIVTVPEPGTFPLLGLGALPLVAMLTRRHKS